jgi:hypothetical protein
MTGAWEATRACCRASEDAGLGHCPACDRPLGGMRGARRTRDAGPPPPPREHWTHGRLNRAALDWLRSQDLRRLALWLACIPFLIGPPTASLALFGLRLWRTPDRSVLRRWAPVAALAVLNIALSAYVLAYVSGVAWDASLDGLRSLRDLLLPWRGAPPVTGPLPVPV